MLIKALLKMNISKIILVAMTVLVGVNLATAQPIRDVPRDKKLAYAEEKLAIGDQYSALEVLTEIYDDDTKKAVKDFSVVRKICNMYLVLRDYPGAERWLQRLVRGDKEGKFPTARFEYAQVLKMNKKYDDAQTEFEQFKKEYSGSDMARYQVLTNNEIAGIPLARTWAAYQPAETVVKSIGSRINTPSQEASPVSAGGADVFYASFGADTIVTLGKDQLVSNEKHLRIYKTSMSEDGTWAKGEALDKKINAKAVNTFDPAFSLDKKTFFFTRGVLSVNEVKGAKIYQASYDGSSFGEPTELSINSNDFKCKNPALGLIDGKEVLFFSSSMPGGQGGWDIWYSMKNSDGSFSTALNAGDKINTVGDEITPHIWKNKMFFSSNGHPTIGGYDIFSADMLNMGSWGNIQNMGESYNSNVDDFYFVVADNPCYAYLVSNRSGTVSLKSETCCDDVWVMTSPDRCPAELSVNTFDISNSSPLSGVKVELFDADSGQKIDEATNVANNTFKFQLSRNKNYKLVASRPGYANGTGTITTIDLPKNKVGQVDSKLYLDPGAALAVKTFDARSKLALNDVKVTLMDDTGKELDTKSLSNMGAFNLTAGKTYKLKAEKTGFSSDYKTYTAVLGKKDAELEMYLGLPLLDTIYYDFDKFNIRQPDAVETLDRIIETLKLYSGLVVEVGSHTDALGSNEYNNNLSNNRTASAIKYMSERGIVVERLVPVGYGEGQPIAPNDINGKDYPVGRQKNRRTVFRILRGLDEAPASSTEKKN
jgi:outer membrane protein OmpA-like peptidoglycan-associated protein